MKLKSALYASALVVGISVSAHALTNPGAVTPVATVQSVDGKTLDTRTFRGKTTLVFYESKDVVGQNLALKKALEHQKKTTGRGDDVQIVAVADVSAYDYWPARGFVTDAIRKEEKKAGHPIYLDWNGSLGKAFGMSKTASNVVVVGPDRKVRVSHAGPVPADKALQILMATGK